MEQCFGRSERRALFPTNETINGKIAHRNDQRKDGSHVADRSLLLAANTACNGQRRKRS